MKKIRDKTLSSSSLGGRLREIKREIKREITRETERGRETQRERVTERETVKQKERYLEHKYFPELERSRLLAKYTSLDFKKYSFNINVMLRLHFSFKCIAIFAPTKISTIE